MTPHQEAYVFILETIKLADSYFAIKCVDYNIDHFKSCYPELRGMRSELIDARHDRFTEMRKPNIQIKNQNNDHSSTT